MAYGAETLGDAWDGFMSFFGGGDSSTPAPDYSSSGGGAFSLDGGAGNGYNLGVDTNLGSPDLSSVGSTPMYGDLSLNLPTSFDSPGSYSQPSLSNVDPKTDAPWYTNPNILSAGITAGAGLLNGMGAQDTQRRALAAQQEQAKMKNLLELAQLKNSILMKQSSGSGRRASGGSGAANQAAAVDRQYSANKVSQLSNLGSNLANIYRG